MSTIRTVRMFRIFALSLFAIAMAHADSVDVTVDVTPVSGGLFQYDYTIADPTGDLFDLDIAVTPGTMITGLTAPGGDSPTSAFNTAYDSVLGLVSFIQNLGFFTATPESGFQFDSPTGPGDTTFTANLALDGITVQTGDTQGPVASATPEPSSLALCVIAGAAVVLGRKKALAARARQL